MIHPQTRVVRISPEVGLGVVATALIPRGTLLWVQDRFDRVVTRQEGLDLDPGHRAILERWAHLDGEGAWILCWDAGRLVNHACDPAMRGLGPSAMVARRDLEPGDEVTCDYAECHIEQPLQCDCGSPRCRHVVHGRDLLTHGSAWDDEARGLSVAAGSLPQPLLDFAIDRSRLASMIAGTAQIPSFASTSPFRPGAALA